MTPNRGAVIDLDGTVYRGEAPIEGSAESIAMLRDAGYETLFLTNAAMRSRRSYSERLERMGISATPEEILSSGVVTAEYIAEMAGEPTVFVVGEEALREEIESAGVEVTDEPESADVVVSSLDRSLDYSTLTQALRAMDGETLFVATNPDKTRPLEDGEAPSTAAITGAIRGMTGRDPDAIVGKPSEVTTDVALRTINVDAEDCILVGDRLETDIAMGAAAGMTTVLVLSGVTDRDDLPAGDVRPDHVIESLGEIEEVLTTLR